MTDGEPIPFFKKVATPPLLWGSFAPIQIAVLPVALILTILIAWPLGGALAATAAAGVTFVGMKLTCTFLNTRRARGFVGHKIKAIATSKNFTPGKASWYPVSVPAAVAPNKVPHA